MPPTHRATLVTRAGSAGLLATAVLFMTACSADEPVATAEPTEVTDTPSGEPSPSATSAGFTKTSDVVYMTMNNTDLLSWSPSTNWTLTARVRGT